MKSPAASGWPAADGACEALTQEVPQGADMPMTGVNRLWRVEPICAGSMPRPDGDLSPGGVACNRSGTALYRNSSMIPGWLGRPVACHGYRLSITPSGAGTFSNGVADLGGNVWEWTSTCAEGAETDRCPAYLAEGLQNGGVDLVETRRRPAPCPPTSSWAGGPTNGSQNSRTSG